MSAPPTLRCPIEDEINILLQLRRNDDLPCGTLLIGGAYLQEIKGNFGIRPDAQITSIYGLRVWETAWPHYLEVAE